MDFARSQAIKIYPILICLIFLSSGCGGADSGNSANMATKSAIGVPILDIESPDLVSETNGNEVFIKGSTDRDQVFVGNQVIQAIDGDFAATIPLKEGINIIPVEAGNGNTTTTINIKVTKNNYE